LRKSDWNYRSIRCVLTSGVDLMVQERLVGMEVSWSNWWWELSFKEPQKRFAWRGLLV